LKTDEKGQTYIPGESTDATSQVSEQFDKQEQFTFASWHAASNYKHYAGSIRYTPGMEHLATMLA